MNKKAEKLLEIIMVMAIPLLGVAVRCIKDIFRGYVPGYAGMLFYVAALSAVTVPFLLLHQRKHGRLFMAGAVVLLVMADQIIKFILSSLDDVKIEMIPHVFSLEISKNVFHTAMLSFFRIESGIPGVLLIRAAALLALLAGISLIKKRFKRTEYVVWIFILMLAGSIASFCDTLFWGYTLDYLYFYAYTVIDLKDIYLSAGAGLVNVTLLREYFYQKNGGGHRGNTRENIR